MSTEHMNVSHHAQISVGEVGFHKQVSKCQTQDGFSALT